MTDLFDSRDGSHRRDLEGIEAVIAFSFALLLSLTGATFYAAAIDRPGPATNGDCFNFIMSIVFLVASVAVARFG